jgi:CDGSH-type Zn-finger protein
VIKRPETGVAGDVLRLTARSNGPLHCFGAMRIVGDDGSEWSGDQANLCRCGQSGNKPFCDGSHRHAGFSTD